MSVVSKYVSLKNYIPTGLPKETDFEIKSKEISMNDEKNVLVSNSWISVDPYTVSYTHLTLPTRS